MPANPPPPPTATASAPTGTARRHWLAWTFGTVVALVLVFALFVRPYLRPAGPARGGWDSRPMPVVAEPARKSDLDVRVVALGTVTPANSVTVHSRVDGQFDKIYFQEGTEVEAGAPLADLDPRPFQVQRQQSEAQLAKDQALLDNARLDLERYQTLLAQDSVAKQQVDSQAALVSQYEATIKVDQAQIASAALQLAYTHITAPIAGRIGLRAVDPGNIVHASDPAGIAVITQLKPITVIFAIPQDTLPRALARFKSGEPMVVDAYDSDGHTLLAKGRLVTIDNQIDPTTGTVKLRAEFPNTDEALFPNQFVNVQLVVDEIKGATVVPNGAIQRGTVGTFVYVVTGQKTSTVRPVTTGPSDRGLTVVSKGLQPGELVVVDGVDKLREGAAVELVSPAATAPAADGTDQKADQPPAGHGRNGGRRPQT